jgi:heme o synthase
VLFALLFVWQLPHFVAIAIFRQAEYERAGIKVHPAVHGIESAKRAAFGYSLLLLAVSMLPLFVGLAGRLYLVLALTLGVGFAAYAALGLKKSAGTVWARRLFFASMPYLVAVFGALVVSAFLSGA